MSCPAVFINGPRPKPEPAPPTSYQLFRMRLKQLIVLIVLFSICYLVYLPFHLFNASAERDALEAYRAYSKLHPEVVLSFDEWQHLENRGLLPHQNKTQTETEFYPIVIPTR